MKNPALLLAALALVTAHGFRPLHAAQATAASAQAQPQKAKPDPRFLGIKPEYHAYLKTLEETEPRMMEYWLEARSLYAEARKLATSFGTRVRKQDRRELPRVLAKAEKAEELFLKEFAKVQEPLEAKAHDIKQRALRLSEQQGATDNPALSQRIKKLYDEAYIISPKLSALTEIRSVFHNITRSLIPSPYAFVGIDVHDSEAQKMAHEHEDLIEARLVIKDCQADIAEIKKIKAKMEADPDTRWSRSHEAQLERAMDMLERADEQLQRLASRAKAPYERNVERYQKLVDRTQEKIDRYEERGRSTSSYEQRLSGYQGDLNQALKGIAFIDKLATWKAPPKTPAK